MGANNIISTLPVTEGETLANTIQIPLCYLLAKS